MSLHVATNPRSPPPARHGDGYKRTEAGIDALLSVSVLRHFLDKIAENKHHLPPILGAKIGQPEVLKRAIKLNVDQSGRIIKGSPRAVLVHHGFHYYTPGVKDDGFLCVNGVTN